MFCREPMVRMEKVFFRKGGFPYTRCVSYESDLWLMAEKYFDDVKNGEECGLALKYHLKDNYYFMSNSFNNDYYIGIHKVSDDGAIDSRFGMYFCSAEWEVFLSHFHEIKKFIQGKLLTKHLNRGMKRNHVGTLKEKKSKVDIYMYKWKWMEGLEVVTESKEKFFIKEHAEKDAEMNKPNPYVHKLLQEPELKIEVFVVDTPDSIEQMKVILYYMLFARILEIAKQNCEACQVNSDSQSDHLKSGFCLGDEDSILSRTDAYFDQAWEEIKSYDIVHVFDLTRLMIGATPIFPELIAKCAKAYLDPQSVKAKLLGEFVPEEMKPLIPLVVECYSKFITQKNSEVCI